VLGLAPLTGVPLPFVSYGSTSLVVMLWSMGLLMAVASGGSAHVRAVRSSSGSEEPARRPAAPRAREGAAPRRPRRGAAFGA
jgi:cell division protein FtsW